MGGAASCMGGRELHFVDDMILTERQIACLTKSWEGVYCTGDAEKIGAIMFKKMFERAPETFAMFTNFCSEPDWENSRHYKHHCKVVVNVLGSVVKALRTPDIMDKNLGFMGLKHCLLSITPEQFSILGEEFVIAFALIVSEEKFGAEEKQAWSQFYTILALTIQKYMKFYS